MALSLEKLIEKLNQRLSSDLSDENPGSGGEEEIDPIEAEDIYPADFGPLLASLNKVFGKDAFVRPAKENDELLCVYFDPEVYSEHNEEALSLAGLQEWCYDKGFAIVSRMQDENVVKVYFTVNRMVDDVGEEGEIGKRDPDKEYSKDAFEKNDVGKVFSKDTKTD
jgi:hypothetical protein